jgi:pimeloyl-ACP methyl ester carboxylesterase
MIINARGLHFNVEMDGDENAPVVLLLAGLGMQLIEWPDALIEALARNFWVIRIDNRDAGLSSICGPEPDPAAAVAWSTPQQVAESAAYSVFDMRDDVLAVLDQLGIEKFNCVGFSMGGVISQLVAAAGAERVERLVQICSTGGERNFEFTKEALLRIERLFHPFPNRQELVDTLIDDAIYFSRGAAIQEMGLTRAISEKIVSRGYLHGGAARQALAIGASGDRASELKKIKAQTLIIHGERDPCVSMSQAERAAELIPNSTLHLFSMLGHNLNAEVCTMVESWLLEGLHGENKHEVNGMTQNATDSFHGRSPWNG